MELKFDKEKFVRTTRMLTRKEIGERLNISTQAVSTRLGKNIDNIRLREFLAICEMLEMHPSEFLEEKNES